MAPSLVNLGALPLPLPAAGWDARTQERRGKRGNLPLCQPGGAAGANGHHNHASHPAWSYSGRARALVNEALRTSENANGISLLGGDLSHSTWGDPQHAAATLRWLKAHPWIALLDAHDLLSARPREPLPDRLATRGSQRLPETMAKELAWASAQRCSPWLQTPGKLSWRATPLSRPVRNCSLALRRTYLGYVKYFT